jgi:hypothetical protein
MKWLPLICLGLCLTIDIFAAERFFRSHQGDNYLVSYQQNQKWLLDHILIAPGKMQEKLKSYVFNSKQELEVFEIKNFGHLLKQKAMPNKSSYVTTELNQSIWQVKHLWDEQWEVRYAQWLQQEFNEDFFVKYNIATDCADAAFALRWIFARMHGLPAANTMAGSLMLFTQDSMKLEWSTLARHLNWHQDELFLTALNYLMQHAYTGTLNIDGYPIELTKHTFLVGTIHLDGGHTMIISEIDYQARDRAPIWKLSSTVPQAVRKLALEMMLDSNMTAKEYGGLFRLRWPVQRAGKWELVAKDQMPYYSLEQYEEDFLGEDNHFTLALIKKLGMSFNPKSIVKEAAQTTLDYLMARIPIVESGYQFCSHHDCSEGTMAYEEHSTPTRDKRLFSKFLAVDELVEKFGHFDSTLADFWTQFKLQQTFTVLGITKTLAELETVFKYGFASSHPEDTPSERWGINEESINSFLNKKITRTLDRRETMLAAASQCVGDFNACQRGTNLWEKFNTYDYDLELKEKVYGTYYKFCELYNACSNFTEHQYYQKLINIPFYISEPYVSMDQKWGTHEKNLDYVLLPKAREIIQLSSVYFWLDNRLFNIETRNFEQINLVGYERTSFQKKWNILVGIYDNKVQTITIDTMQTKEVFFNEKLIDLFWLNDEHFIIQGCIEPTHQQGCVRRYFKLEASGDITQLSMLPIRNVTVTINYEDQGLKTINEGYLKTAVYNEYSYSTSSYQTTFEYFINGILKSENLAVTDYVSIESESTEYILFSMESQRFVLEKFTANRCELKQYKDLYISYLGHNVFMAQDDDNNEYNLFEMLPNCNTKLLLMSQGWPDIKIKQNEMTVLDHEAKAFYRLKNGHISKHDFPSGFFFLNYVNDTITWGKINQTASEIVEAFTYNLVLQTRSDHNPRYIPTVCQTNFVTLCYGTSLYQEIYFKNENNILTHFATLLDQGKNPVISVVKSVPHNEMRESQRVEVQKGIALELMKDYFLYLKP